MLVNTTMKIIIIIILLLFSILQYGLAAIDSKADPLLSCEYDVGISLDYEEPKIELMPYKSIVYRPIITYPVFRTEVSF